jgi:hypothetical protein|tara:strand:+ start:22 stop:510 length:489 start_codon:yes stop_codon:yes gene_type:complete
MNRNKEKGKAFERFVANDLSDVFGLSFTRTPNSGAYVGGMNKHRMKTLSNSQILLTEGDIIVPDEMYNLKIECKSYKSFSFHQLFSECKQLDIWIDQAYSEEKLWFLIFKINRAGSYVCFSDTYADRLITDNSNNLCYSKYIIQSYDGFFPRNKDVLLNLCK